jgi:glucokinase-like ROK family protein
MFRIGIDLGGTNIAVGAVDEAYHIVSKVSIPTGSHRPWQEVVADMGNAAEQAAAKAGLSMSECASMGIGSPGNCDSGRGVVVRAYNLGWLEVPVCQTLHERFGVPVKLSNDANCAALAEAVAGRARGKQDVVMITLGTGVGSGIIINGQIYAGMRSAGGEWGHTVLVLDGEECTCGRRGCWEAYASATALIRQTRQAALEHPQSLLAKTPAEKINGRTAFDAARAGDEVAKGVVTQYIAYIGAGLTDLVNALAPEMIVLGGGICNEGETLLAPLRDYVADHCFGQHEGAIPEIVAATLGNDAGIIGAAAL